MRASPMNMAMRRRIGRVGGAFGGLALVGALALAGCDDSASSRTPSSESIEASAPKSTPQAALTPTPAVDPVDSTETVEPIIKATPSPQTADSGEPKLVFELVEHDFGEIYEKEALEHDFVFRNDGDAPLTITRVAASCGCTATKLEKKTFEPGESDRIEVTYTPKGPGKASKFITVLSDDPEEPSIRLKISAELIPVAYIEPTRLQMGQIRTGQEHKGLFTVMSRDPNFEIAEVSSRSEHLSFEVEPMEKDSRGLARKKVIVTFAKRLPSGAINERIDFKILARVPGSEETREFDVNGNIFAMVRGDLTTTPRFIRVNRTEPNEAFEARTRLFTDSGLPFTVTGITVEQSTIDDVETEFVAVPKEEGGGYWIIVKGTTGARPGAFRGTLVVEHDLASEGPISIVFNGIIRGDRVRTDQGGQLPNGVRRAR